MDKIQADQAQVEGIRRNGSAQAAIQLARRQVWRRRKHAIHILEDVFRAGQMPDPWPDGRYQGELFGFQLGLGLNLAAEWVSQRRQPWQGKIINAAMYEGLNLWKRSWLLPARLFWPFYRDWRHDWPTLFRAFPFQLYPGVALDDPTHPVLKLDYDLENNPRRIVRGVLDELVQIGEAFYFGKAYQRWRGRWQPFAYFTLFQ